MSNFLGKANIFWQDRRRAAFAGTWYEADPARLRAQLEDYLQKADADLSKQGCDHSFPDNQPVHGSVLAIVAPHAGYVFSGSTAAYSYDLAKRQKVSRVFIMGPSHYVGFQGGALPAEKVFSSPLGDLMVDTELIEDLKQYPMFAVMPEVHRREHSLELQLPFIKEAFPDAKIVPIIIGSFADETEIRLTAQILKRHLRQDDLVVVSSDFTHYGPRYQYEPFHDHIDENVRKLDEEAFQHIQSRDLDGFVEFRERTQDTICGFFPCSILMAMLPEKAHATLLHYGTSKDTLKEDDENSVSYMAIAVSNSDSEKGWADTDSPDQDLEQITEKDKETLLKIARTALETYVREHRQIKISDFETDLSSVMRKPAGAFVTLYKREPGAPDHSREHKELRGCIGYIWPVKPLVQAVIENAIGAASRDGRFPNVSPDELKALLIDVNVLTPPRRIDAYKDIQIGRHGIVMYKNGRQAVFLPSVATDFGWNLEQTLTQLSIKAGCGADGWKHGAQWDIFQSDSFEEHF